MNSFTTFHLVNPVGSSSFSPPTSMSPSLSHSLEWHMLIIRPFKEIANRLAHFWSYLSVNLPSPPRLSLWDFIPGRGRGACYRHYRSPAEEQKWWDESARIRRAFFAPLDARYDGRATRVSAPVYLSPIPLIMSYVPRLLPQYRDHYHLDDAATEYELTPSVYRKWHRLVFPNEILPSRRKVARVIRYLSTRDRQEIARIARLVPDGIVAQKGFLPSSAYRDLWTSWLEHKGPDLTIVFE